MNSILGMPLSEGLHVVPI